MESRVNCSIKGTSSVATIKIGNRWSENQEKLHTNGSRHKLRPGTAASSILQLSSQYWRRKNIYISAIPIAGRWQQIRCQMNDRERSAANNSRIKRFPAHLIRPVGECRKSPRLPQQIDSPSLRSSTDNRRAETRGPKTSNNNSIHSIRLCFNPITLSGQRHR